MRLQSCAVAKLFLSLPSLQRLDAVIKLKRSHTERETFIKLHAIMRHDLSFPATGTFLLTHLHGCAVEQSHNCKFTTLHICTDGQPCNYNFKRLLLVITTSLRSCAVVWLLSCIIAKTASAKTAKPHRRRNGWLHKHKTEQSHKHPTAHFNNRTIVQPQKK